MKQPIPGVAPHELGEVTVMTVWPSVAAYPPGRWLGQLFAIRAGWYIFTLGNLFALMSIPVALVLFFWRLAPFVGARYRLTNRRIVVERGLRPNKVERYVDLDRFDSIDVVVQPGQAWYDAGDLVFHLGNVETFRLAGVSRPQSFRHTCLKSRMAHVGVAKARQRQTAQA
jgi:hypothetical protein